MADDEEDKLLEVELELQLREQRDSITDLKEALVSDPTNPELVSVYEELVQAIKEAEEELFHLKRARLLREADFFLQDSKYIAEDVKAEPLDPAQVEAEPLEDQGYSVGSKCRFRHTDGRWYNGLIIGFEGSDLAKTSFLTPTSENMLICKFFLQQRCRFGTNCRLSHGVDIPLSSLKKYIPTAWDQSLVGSSIWAVCDSKTSIWREAELESWDDERRMAQVVFGNDGASMKLGSDYLTLSKYAQMTDEEENESSSEQSDDGSEYEGGDSECGLGFHETTALQKGIQTETVIFAKWENHTRGIASKMMANMGYREGMGLGVSGQGIVDPISVKVLPPKQSLDRALESRKNEESKEKQGKKRSRGGKRKRDKKFAAAAAKVAKEEEESEPDVFSLINTQLAMHSEAVNGRVEKKQNEGKKEDRRAILAYDDEVKELRTRVEKLEEMASRNRNEKVVYEAAMRKLNETRKLLTKAEAAHASVTSAVANKEREKRWLKF